MTSSWAICPGCNRAVFLASPPALGERQPAQCACGAVFNVWLPLPCQPRCAQFRQWRERERNRLQFQGFVQLLQKLFTR